MGRPKQSFEDSVVYDDLRYWGYYKGRQCAADGYSPENTIAHILSGQSGVVGHRVLVLDMTPRAWQISYSSVSTRTQRQTWVSHGARRPAWAR